MIWAAYDGIGWLLAKRCYLMKQYGWSPGFVRTGLTSAQGWAYLAAAREMELTMFGAVWRLKGDGYIGQERKRLLAMVK